MGKIYGVFYVDPATKQETKIDEISEWYAYKLAMTRRNGRIRRNVYSWEHEYTNDSWFARPV